MASPFNSTDELNTQSGAQSGTQSGIQAAAQSGTQMSKPAQSSSVLDANDAQSEESEQTAKPKQRAQRAQSADRQPMQNAQGTGVDVLRGSLTNAFDQIVKEIEPQINEFATNFAHQAMDKGADYGRQAVQRVQKQSWGRIGLAAALIAGAVAILGYTAAESVDEESLH